MQHAYEFLGYKFVRNKKPRPYVSEDELIEAMLRMIGKKKDDADWEKVCRDAATVIILGVFEFEVEVLKEVTISAIEQMD